MRFVSSVALLSLICSPASTIFIASTSCAPLMSFSRPRLMLVSDTCSALSLDVYVVMYVLMKERYDLGVWYTCRRLDTKYSWQTSTTSECATPMWMMSASLVAGSASSAKSPR